MGWTINKKITAIKDLLQCFAYRNNVVKIEYVTNFFLGVGTKYVINIEDTNGYSINKFLFSTCFDDKNKIESITVGGGNLKGIYSSICKYRSLFGLKVIEEFPVCCAMRGRYNEQGKIEQQLEINSSDYANALTTVQKDCMILEELTEQNKNFD